MRQKDGKVDQKLNTKLNNLKNIYYIILNFMGYVQKENLWA